MPTSLELLELEAILREYQTAQKSIVLSREYYNGEQWVYLTTRQKEYLGLHTAEENEFKLNVCRTIVNSLANELDLTGFATDEQGDKKPVQEWLDNVFKSNKLNSLQDTVHQTTLSESETFTVVEWDDELAYPKILHNIRWTGDVPEDELQYGMTAVYENNDPTQKLYMVVKQWYQTDFTEAGTPFTYKRRTMYTKDKIIRLWYDGGTWREYEMDDMPAIVDWTLGGKPMGLATQHFTNSGYRSEHWDAIPMQDAINKTLVDILGAEDLTGFQSYFGFNIPPTLDGKEPAADGSNVRKIGPGVMNTTSRMPSEASLQVLSGADVTPMLNALTQFILYVAQITDTPASKFIATAAIASAETIKEQDKALRRKASNRRSLFGDVWVQVMNMCRKVANKYGNAGLDETVSIIPVWNIPESLTDISTRRTTLNIPIEQAWAEAGYNADQIQAMKKAPSYMVQFESVLWQGATTATQNIPLETYLARCGVPEDEIAVIMESIQGQSAVPPTTL